MGLLDIFSTPESMQGLLAASGALLEAGGPSRTPVSFGQALGRGMNAGQGAYQDALKQKMLKEKMLQDKLMQDMQIKQLQFQQSEAQRKAAEEAQMRALASRFMRPGGPGMPANEMDSGADMGQTAPSFDDAGYATALKGVNPLMGEQYKQLIEKPDANIALGPEQGLFNRHTNQWLVKPTFRPEKPEKKDIGALVIEGPNGRPMINPIALEARKKIAEAGRAPKAAAAPAPPMEGGEDQAAWTKRFGKAPAGFRWKPDGSQERIPGGPADVKATAADERLAKHQSLLSGQAKDVLETIKDAKSLVGWDTAGPAGVLAILPMTDARQLAGHVDTIKANLGFDRLQQMRDLSPTGGALGQVAVQEINYLQSTVRKLDQLQRPKDILQALDKIEGHYSRWLKTLEGASPDVKPESSAPMQTATNPQTGEKLMLKDGKWVPLK